MSTEPAEPAAIEGAPVHGEGAEPPPSTVVRFDLPERLVHWTTALLLLSLLATGTILYVPGLMLAVGHRATIENIHVVTGFGLLAPILAGLAGPWRSALVDDIRRLDRWGRQDFAFFRPRRAGPVGRRGKFNGGQKAAAAVLAGGSLVMIVTGTVMRWSPPFPNELARGATLVHDVVYLVLFAVVVGHLVVALSRPVQLRSMFTGHVPLAWARRHGPAWLDGSDLRTLPTGRARRPRQAAAPPRRSAPRREAAHAGRRPASG
ncbi:MAG TPA: cytochrome b/b6 domain-containing protein [Acidimicrobiales bacterium]|nr:cytochrome b/b6 domain-containing protein [Acidimicrobiales bacterium]